jgi:SHS2 domain-containing protein
VPRVPLEGDQHDVEESRRQQLLALRDLRRGLERVSPCRRRYGCLQVEVDRAELLRELDELIAALDRRVPRVERAGESSIARDAAALREKAVKRLVELTKHS